MTTRNIVATAAAGSNWTSPLSSIAEDGACASFAGGLPTANVLTLSQFTDRSLPAGSLIAGLTVRIKARGELTPFSERYSSVYLDDWSPTLPQDAHLSDGDDSTWVDFFSQATVLIDLGQAMPIVQMRMVYYAEPGLVARKFSYSNDGVTWTNFGALLGIETTQVDAGSGRTQVVVTANVSATARYWRAAVNVSAIADPSPPSSLTMYGFDVFDANGRVTSSSAGRERLIVAITKDGGTDASTPMVCNLTNTLEWYEFGGLADLIGSTLSADDIASASFGLRIRRADVLGNENTATARFIDAHEIGVHFLGGVGGRNMRASDLNKTIIGREVTPGTPVAPTTQLQTLVLNVEPANRERQIGLMGDLVDEVTVIDSVGATGSISGPMTYDELGVALTLMFGAPQSIALGSGAYQHEWVFNSSADSNPAAYTYQQGDTAAAEQVAFVTGTALNFNLDGTGAPTIGGAVVGREWAPRVDGGGNRLGLTAGANAQQTWTISGGPTGGSVTVSFAGARATVTNTAMGTAAGLKTALEALSTIGAGNLTVTGANGGPYTITFSGAALAGVAQPRIEIDVNSLTGGTAPAVATAITVAGGYTRMACVPVARPNVELRIANAPEGLDDVANRLTVAGGKELHKGTWGIQSVRSTYEVLDPTQPSWAGVGDTDSPIVSSATITANQLAATLHADYKAQTPKFLRWAFTSAALAQAGVPYSLTVDTAVTITSVKGIDVGGTVVTQTFEARGRRDAGWGRALRVRMVNRQASY